MMANNGTGGRGARLGDEGEVADQPRRRNFTADKLTGYGLSLVVEDLEDVPEPPRPDNVECRGISRVQSEATFACRPRREPMTVPRRRCRGVCLSR